MTIEIHSAETEALIEQRMATGTFHDVEDVLLDALKSAPSPQKSTQQPAQSKTLVEVCAMVRGLIDDIDITRDPSPGRSVDLA